MASGPMLMERSEQLLSLMQIVDRAQAGAGAAGLVLGPVASGKTALSTTLCEYAAHKGFAVLRAVASCAEHSTPFGVADQLLRSAPMGMWLRQQASRLSVHYGQVDGAASGRADVPPDRLPLLRELTQSVLEQSEITPLLLCLDNIHLADQPSTDWITYLLRRIAQSRIAVVLTDLTSWQRPVPALRDAILLAADCRPVFLTPLTKHGIAALLQSLQITAETLDADLAMALTGGNPLLTHALVDDINTGERSADDVRQPGTGYAFRRAAASCLRQIGEAAQAVTAACAVLGPESSTELLAELLDMSLPTVEAVVRDISSVGLLDQGQFRHSAVRTAVLQEAPAAELGRLHRRTARLLHQRGAEPQAILDHLLATDSPEGDWDTALLCDAARQAADAGNAQLARQCAEHACRLPTSSRRGEALTLRAEIEWHFAVPEAPRHTARLGEAIRANQLNDRWTAESTKLLLRMGLVAEAAENVRILTTATATATATDLRTAAELRTLQAQVSLSYPGIPAMDGVRTAKGTDTRFPATAVRADPRVRTAALLSDVLRDRASASTYREAVQVLLSIRVTHHTWEQADFALLALLYGERLSEADRAVNHLLTQVNTIRAQGWLAPLLALRAEVALRSGRLREAEEDALESMRHETRGQDRNITVGATLATLISAQTARGQHDSAAGWLNHPVPQEMYQTRYGIHYLHARGEHRLTCGQTAAALEDFLICGDLVDQWDMDTSGLVPWRTSAARAHLHEHRRREAKLLIDEELRRLPPDQSRSRGVALRISAQTVDLKHRTALLLQAVDNLQRAGNLVELSRALMDLGHVYRGLGDRKRSRAMINRARRLAAESAVAPIMGGMSDLLDPGAGVITQAGGPALAVDGLTEAERRVATLAVVGHTNRDIAKSLFITVSTVEQHLTRIYRKLNVAGRTSLPDALIVRSGNDTPNPPHWTRTAS